MLVYDQRGRCDLDQILADPWLTSHRAPHQFDDPLARDLHSVATEVETEAHLASSAEDLIIQRDPFRGSGATYSKGAFLGGGAVHSND